jgi:hypothetical protein
MPFIPSMIWLGLILLQQYFILNYIMVQYFILNYIMSMFRSIRFLYAIFVIVMIYLWINLKLKLLFSPSLFTLALAELSAGLLLLMA